MNLNDEDMLEDEVNMDKLSPRMIATGFMVEDQKLVKATDCGDQMESHFVCQICLKVVNDPVECNKCSTAVCRGCVDLMKGLNGGSKCPFKCQNMEFVELHRYAKVKLGEILFVCPMYERGCRQDVEDSAQIGLPYSKAMSHQKVCKFRKVYCQLHCGAKVYNHEVEEHLLNCPQRKEKCPKCSLDIFVNQRKYAAHDCIQEMKRELARTKKEHYQLKKELGINYDEMNNVCKENHKLYQHEGFVRTYNGVP
mmetsp:Transcript_8497/g.14290  ORF Transcript_8497/g.14290 Transcript_8497/m.14290 type:complete len:252 (+) Transcript_8497:19-774(+)